MIDSNVRIVQNTRLVIPSIIHAVNGCGNWIECDRLHWRNEWRVVDAQPGTMWPTNWPKEKAKCSDTKAQSA